MDPGPSHQEHSRASLACCENASQGIGSKDSPSRRSLRRHLTLGILVRSRQSSAEGGEKEGKLTQAWVLDHNGFDCHGHHPEAVLPDRALQGTGDEVG